MRTDQQDIIARLQAKDKQAMSELYDNYSGALYGLLLRLTKEEGMAQDLLQETFIKIWKYIDRYDAAKGSLFTWMARIARNTALNTLQSKSNRQQQSLRPITNEETDKTFLEYTNVNKIGLKGLVAQLDEKYSTVIDLAYFQGYTQKEIEDHLNIPLGTVKSRLRIALRQLRKLFDYEQKLISILICLVACGLW
ncbi:MAG: sigma-70 family RNA polymerase sigma factor [Bacteroidota bacterium]